MDYPLSDPTIGLVGGKFTDGNPGGGIAASRDPSSWANLVTDELLNLLAAADIVPDETNNAQVLQAIQQLTTGRLINTRIFAAPGSSSYVPTAGTKMVRVKVVGGGGGGGNSLLTSSSTVSTGGGGGAGGFAESVLAAGFSGVTITVGAGGSYGAPGGNGGTSSFGALLSATGGVGGATGPIGVPTIAVTSSGSGAGSGGNIVNSRGCVSLMGIVSATTYGQSGAGGASVFGNGGAPCGTSNDGSAASSPGSGGGGALSLTSSAAHVGGSGASGIVIVEEFA